MISPAVESVPSSPIIRDFFEQVKQEGRLDDEYDDHEAVIPSAQEESPGNTAAIPEPLVGSLEASNGELSGVTPAAADNGGQEGTAPAAPPAPHPSRTSCLHSGCYQNPITAVRVETRTIICRQRASWKPHWKASGFEPRCWRLFGAIGNPL